MKKLTIKDASGATVGIWWLDLRGPDFAIHFNYPLMLYLSDVIIATEKKGKTPRLRGGRG